MEYLLPDMDITAREVIDEHKIYYVSLGYPAEAGAGYVDIFPDIIKPCIGLMTAAIIHDKGHFPAVCVNIHGSA